jgi:hypothetical protein
LNNAAELQHYDAVEIPHGREPMRDGDDSAPLHQAAERLADRFLRFAVERGGRLVEQEERRVLEERPRDRNALTLSARELDASVADDSANTIGQTLDEVAARSDRRFQRLVVGARRGAKSP